MQEFSNQKRHCIQNYVGSVKTGSLSVYKDNDTFTYFKIKTKWIHQQNSMNVPAERMLSLSWINYNFSFILSDPES
jgi:hypothetical protein